MFCSELLYIPEAKASHPLFFSVPLYEVTATNKVVTFFIFFLLTIQVTLEAVPSIPAEFQQETFPFKKISYYKLNIYRNKHPQQLLIKKRSLIRFQLFQPFFGI